ncbi:hypothetical protein Tco_1520424, partial [Tanacetum coccineum]
MLTMASRGKKKSSMDHDHSDKLQADLAKARKKCQIDQIYEELLLGLLSYLHLLLHHLQILTEAISNKWKPHDDDERPTTLEPAWVIPTSHIPDAVNNWANALASTYQVPIENSLLEKTGDMWTFMN